MNEGPKGGRSTRLGWIKKKQREFEGQARQSERRYVSGETHFVLGSRTTRTAAQSVQTLRIA